jgi:5-methylcytosine-specific restriction enzyme A
MEGLTAEQRQKVRLRAAWLADRFIRGRRNAGTMICDDCGFDPRSRINGAAIKPRSLLDVHHRDPLAEGRRYTTERDFELLCPTCHRFKHALMRLQ